MPPPPISPPPLTSAHATASPSVNPLRPASNGRAGPADNDISVENPEYTNSDTESQLTTSTSFASPCRTIDAARVIAAADDAHADDIAIAGPRNPIIRLTLSSSICGRDSAISDESPFKIARSRYSISPTVVARINGV